MAYDILLKNGTVIDPAAGIHDRRDIGVTAGVIVAVESDLSRSEARRVIDVKDHLLTPGLIDLHTHVARGIMPIALDPDDAGVRCGVTAVSDAGSVGHANYGSFKEFILPDARTDVFSFLHLCPTGQAVSPEIDWESVDPDRTLRLIDEERDVIRGIKIRANGPAVVEPDMKILKTARQVCSAAGLPLMVHLGLNSEKTVDGDVLRRFNRDLLSFLESGDILTHVYSQRTGGVLGGDDDLIAELLEAKKQGIVIDAAPAKSHFSFKLARTALEAGLVPTTLSTDITKTNYRGPALFSLPVVMSKFLALGLSLDEVIEKATVAPARVLKEENRRGSLQVGFPADVSVFELARGDFLFSDGIAGNTLRGNRLLEPRWTLKAGELIEAGSRFRNHIPGEPVTLTRGA